MATLATCSVFSLDFEEHPSRASSMPPGITHHQLAPKQQRAGLLSNPVGWRLRLLQDVRAIQAESRDAIGGTVNMSQHLTAQLLNRGYCVSHRVAATGGIGQACFQHLHNTFLLVWRGTVTALDDACVVDPFFRSNFELSSTWMTPDYTAALPPCDLFVGSFDDLMKLIHLLCTEMAAAFKSRGVSLPPWRTLKAIRSKWSPVTSRAVTALDNCSSSTQSPKRDLATKKPSAKFEAATAAPCVQRLDSSATSSTAPAAAHKPNVSGSRVLRGVAKSPAVAPAPWRVQIGFQVTDVPSLSSSAWLPAVSSLRRKPPASSAFDMWSHKPRLQDGGISANRRKAAAFLAPQADDRLSGVMAPIRTVKMCGRTRA